MWISKGRLDLHHGLIKDYIFTLSERRIANGTLNKKVCTTFNYLLHNSPTIPISAYYMDEHILVNPGKSRLFANWFSHKDDIPIVMCHSPKHPTNILKNQILLRFKNLVKLLDQIDVVNVDDDDKLVFVDKSWSEMKETFDHRTAYQQTWDATIASKYGTIEWSMLGDPMLTIETDLNDHRTIINVSHPLGLYESICKLSGIEEYRVLHFHNILDTTAKL